MMPGHIIYIYVYMHMARHIIHGSERIGSMTWIRLHAGEPGDVHGLES